MKIGIYGGSFNPIHRGHIFVVKYVKEFLGLDKILVIPVGVPSHRENNLADSKLRLEMCKVAFEGMEEVEVSDIEILSSELCYTYDTLLKIIEKYGDNEYFEIIGEDSGAYFHKWKNYKEILDLCKVVVLRREGYATSVENENLIVLDSPKINISSTEIREKIQKGLDISDLVPKKVQEIINKNKIYR